MRDMPNEMQALKELNENALLLQEGGQPVVYLPQTKVRTKSGNTECVDLLLCPAEHAGYQTRLFFDRKVEGVNGNWSQHCIADRGWWALSWQGVSPTLSFREMICAHLRALL